MQLRRGYQITLISSGSTENINLLVVLAGIESKFENWPNHYGLKQGKLRSILYTIHPYPNFHGVTYTTHPHSYLAPTYYFMITYYDFAMHKPKIHVLILGSGSLILMVASAYLPVPHRCLWH